jgi:tRNA dimethylallyltransferase
VREPLFCLVGPTGVGKSEVALAFAERVGAEIVCADSRQVYRGLDIGTAKPSPADRRRVPHHLLDLVDPDEPYSAGRYEREATACLDALHARGVRALVVGGTGLYLRALVGGLCTGPQADERVRAEWLAREREVPGSLYRRLTEIDPVAAAVIHPNDLSKVLRAVEVQVLTGVPLSALQTAHGFRSPRYPVVMVGLRRRRDDLYRRIDARGDAMVADGLIDEVEGLVRRGWGDDAPAMRAVGYRQIVGALAGRWAMDEAIRLVKRDTRRYAKRQMTWFGAVPDLRWIDLDADAGLDDTLERLTACVEDSEAVAPKVQALAFPAACRGECERI